MTTTQPHFAMPFLHTTTGDSGLGDPITNRKKLERLVAVPHEIIYEDTRVLLAITTCPDHNEIFLRKKDENSLTYYVKFEAERIGLLGYAATQVVLWRRAAPGLEQATNFIFDYFYAKFDTIVSDACPTKAGQRFWVDRMAEARQRGWSVGVTDGNTLVPYDDRQTLFDWAQSLDHRDSYAEIESTCFFISKVATRGDLGRSAQRASRL